MQQANNEVFFYEFASLSRQALPGVERCSTPGIAKSSETRANEIKNYGVMSALVKRELSRLFFAYETRSVEISKG